jgi:hypothetical protein
MPDTFWSVLLGGALAIAGGALTEVLRSRSASQREEASRTSARQGELDKIQRDTLLDLQAALTEWVRAVVLVAGADIKSLRETGKLHQLPEGLSDAEFHTGRRLMYLTERVRDDALRGSLAELRSMAAAMETARAIEHREVTLERLDSEQREFVMASQRVHSLLGVGLRRFL